MPNTHYFDATITPALMPTPIISPSPTNEYIQKAQWAKEINALWGSSCSESGVSPDGKWCVIDMGEDIKVFGRDGVTKHTFDFTQTQKEIRQLCGVFFQEFWSPDGQYLYFAPGICSHTTNINDGVAPALYRLTLATGEILNVLPITGDPDLWHKSLAARGYYDFVFSSDGRYLAYLQPYTTPIIVKIRNLVTDEESQFALDEKYPEAGCISWSPNSHFVAFDAAIGTNPGDLTIASLYVVDVEKNKIHEILRDEPYLYCPNRVGNDREGLILITRYDMGSFSGISCSKNERECEVDFYLNPLTMELAPRPTKMP
jgi:hypothetical protein